MPRDLLAEDAPAPVNLLADEAPEIPLTAGRVGGLLDRGAIPVAAGGMLGAAVGSPLGPPGMLAGAAVGSVAMPAADALAGGYNMLAPHLGWDTIESPSDAAAALMDKLGLPRPQNTKESLIETAGGMGAGIAAGPVAASDALAGMVVKGAPKMAMTPAMEAAARAKPVPLVGDQNVRLNKTAKNASGKLYDAMIESGWTPERIAAKLRQIGPDATLADLEPFKGLGETVAQIPGVPAKTAARVYSVRDKQSAGRLMDFVKTNLSPENFYSSIDELKDARTAAAQPARAEALAKTGIVKSDLIQRMMKTPEFQAGIRKGGAIARLEAARTGEEIPLSETWYHGANFDDPNLVIVETPTLRMLDAAKQGFDQILAPFRDKYTGKLVGLGPYEVEVSKAQKAVTGELRKASAKYAEYLDKWAEPSELISAVSKGRQALTADSEITAKMIKDMKPDEKEFYQIGLARALQDKIMDNPASAIKFFEKGSTAAKLRAAFPSPRAYNDFKKVVLSEIEMKNTSRRQLGNSATVRRAAGVADLTANETVPEQAVGAATDALVGNKVGLFNRGVRALTARANRPSPAVAEELTPALYSKDPKIQRIILQRLRRRSGLLIEP